GTGVLMGGAWAYEALSFGGFWAWDPVENASLVPWITLIAGLHTLLAFKNTGHALKATAIFLTLTLWLILYSTFLTRSGILGDTSVHSFTDLGMSGQLLAFMLSFIFISAYLILTRWNDMPSPKKEESAYSREFWMFVGALVMAMLAVLVTVDTSWPVINKLFGTNRVITDPIPHYNRYSVWFGIFIALFSALVQYFRYKLEPLNKLLRLVVFTAVLSAVVTAMTAMALEISHLPNILLLFTAYYSIIANANYIFAGLRGQLKIAGGSVSHIGFGLILLGVIFAFGKQEVISLNTLGIDYGEEWTAENKMENVLLYKDKPIQMGDYWITYLGDSTSAPNTYYKVHYAKKKNETDKPTESFTLYPNAQKNPNMGLIANPSTKHYLTKDVFTHISAATDKELQQEEEGEQLTEIEIAVAETALVSGVMIRLQSINPNPDGGLNYIPMDGDIAAGAKLSIVAKDNTQYEANPIYYIRDNQEMNVEAIVDELNMTIGFDKIFPEKNKIKLSILDRDDPMDWIIMKAVVFPYINVLWLGCFVMLVGFIMSILYRNKEGKQISGVLRKKQANQDAETSIAGGMQPVLRSKEG
ncbi:MAG: cytochrome c biogenesis protein CcsA, partial [Chitinophagales bacterium]